jgi:hypothetical protein
MWPMLIVLQSPSVDVLACIVDRHREIHVQALNTQASIDRLCVPVIRGRTWLRELELDATLPCTFLGPLRRGLGAMIDRQRDRQRAIRQPSISGSCELVPRHREIELNQRTLATEPIDSGEHPERLLVEQLVIYEVHTPALIRCRRRLHRTAMQAHLLAAAHLDALDLLADTDAERTSIE